MDKDLVVGKKIITVLLAIEIFRIVGNLMLSPEGDSFFVKLLPITLNLLIIVLIFNGYQFAKYIFAFLHIASIIVAIPAIDAALSNNRLDWILLVFITEQLLRLLQSILIFLKPVNAYMKYVKGGNRLNRKLGPNQVQKRSNQVSEMTVGGKKYKVRD